MAGTEKTEEYRKRRNTMTNDNNILLKLTDMLQKENLITVHERNCAVELIERKEII